MLVVASLQIEIPTVIEKEKASRQQKEISSEELTTTAY